VGEGNGSAEAIKRYCDGVAGDEVVLHVPSGDSAALASVDWVKLLAEIGALVDRLGVRVTEQELRSVAIVAQRGLERVVVGVGDGAVGGVFAEVPAKSLTALEPGGSVAVELSADKMAVAIVRTPLNPSCRADPPESYGFSHPF